MVYTERQEKSIKNTYRLERNKKCKINFQEQKC